MEKTKRILGRKSVFSANLVKRRQKKHFILSVKPLRTVGTSMQNLLTNKSWDDLFNEGTVEKLGALFIIKLNRQRIELQKTACEVVCPIGEVVCPIGYVISSG